MSKYFNDSPIETPKDDRYGATSFAQSIAKSIVNLGDPEGTTIALHGPWGSGKSSVVNLIRHEIEVGAYEDLVVTEFKGWWYRGDEALALAFLQELHALLSKGIGDKIKDLVPRLTRRVLQAGPVVGTISSYMTGQPILGGLFTKASDFASTFFSDAETVEDIFETLSQVLAKSDKRFLIIIDDIDRLDPEEALSVFRLVKSIGRLPNVLYLLVFDRELAEKIVLERYPSEGPHFLEKIIQTGFEVPSPAQTDLNNAVLTSMDEICGTPDESQVVRIMNISYDVVVPYITTPRHVARFRNAISVTWPAVGRDVNLADFIALETLRLYEPTLFNAMKRQKDALVGSAQEGDPGLHDEDWFDAFLVGVPDSRRVAAKAGLQRLFPRTSGTVYGSDWISEWNSERRVCVDKHFDTYFRLSLSDSTLPMELIDKLVNRADDRDFIHESLRHAAESQQRSGKSMVPVYLDELNFHALRIEKDKVEPLVSALFEIHDEVDLEKDEEKGFWGVGSTTRRYHWLIRRLTRDRFSIEERTSLYLAATEKASLSWLVEFSWSAKRNYSQREDHPPTKEEDCLVAEDAVPILVERALGSIRSAASSGSLLQHRDILSLLYCWANFSEEGSDEVRNWTDAIIESDEGVVLLAVAMTGQSWSMSMGFDGLGDRVSKGTATAKIDDDTDIVDVKAFRVALERVLSEATVDAASLDVVRVFLDAWDRKRRGDEE